MSPEILPLTLMHFALVCHSWGPLTLRTKSRAKPPGPSHAAHSLADTNHPSNALLTKGVCELNSLFRQAPRGDPCVPKPVALPCLHRGLSACAGAQGSEHGYSWCSSSCWSRHRQPTLALPFFPQSSPLPVWAFCTSERTWLLKEKYRVCSASTLTKIDLYFN